jgi:hypothetical protein
MKTVLGKVALQSYYNEENNRGPLLNLWLTLIILLIPNHIHVLS